MKMNPVYKRELTVSSRSIRMALILLIFNSVLAIVALFNMFTVVEQVKVTAEIQYSRFLELYTFVSSIEFLMLMFIMPALTASSISGERERQTLELMLTTTMKPKEIILGKFWSALTTMLDPRYIRFAGTVAGVCLWRNYNRRYDDTVFVLRNRSAVWGNRHVLFIPAEAFYGCHCLHLCHDSPACGRNLCN